MCGHIPSQKKKKSSEQLTGSIKQAACLTTLYGFSPFDLSRCIFSKILQNLSLTLVFFVSLLKDYDEMFYGCNAKEYPSENGKNVGRIIHFHNCSNGNFCALVAFWNQCLFTVLKSGRKMYDFSNYFHVCLLELHWIEWHDFFFANCFLLRKECCCAWARKFNTA